VSERNGNATWNALNVYVSMLARMDKQLYIQIINYCPGGFPLFIAILWARIDSPSLRIVFTNSGGGFGKLGLLPGALPGGFDGFCCLLPPVLLMVVVVTGV